MNKWCIEWHSGTWKTSMTTLLDNAGVIKRFGEYFHYLEKWESFPSIDACAPEELQEIRKQLFTLLMRRENHIRAVETKLPVIYERSPVTLLYTEATRIQQGYSGDLGALAQELLDVL